LILCERMNHEQKDEGQDEAEALWHGQLAVI
jgi:hypothetical protein